MTQIVMYGAAPWPGTTDEPGGARPWVPPATTTTVVWPEDLARQVRELREAVEALTAGKGEGTPEAMARRVVKALIEAGGPSVLLEIVRVCREAGAGKAAKK